MTEPVNGLLAALADDPAAAAGLVDWLLEQKEPMATLARIESRLQKVREELALRMCAAGMTAEAGILKLPVEIVFQRVARDVAANMNLTRIRKVCQRLSVATLGDLVRKSAPELLDCKNFGANGLQYMRQILWSRYRLCLFGDIPP